MKAWSGRRASPAVSRSAACPCRFAIAAPAHHDQLLRAPSEVGMALELVALATTWDEIDYSGEALIPPADWLAFAAAHAWPNHETAERLFGVAVDVVRRGAAVAGFQRARTPETKAC